jgi:ankyrin repeat protein
MKVKLNAEMCYLVLWSGSQVVRVLLGFGAGDGKRINRQNNAGNTALHLACLGHHAEVAYMLHLYNADEYLMNAYDQTSISLGELELSQPNSALLIS